MARVDPQLHEAVEDTRAQVRAAQAALDRRAEDTAREKTRLDRRLADAQRGLLEARQVLALVESQAPARALHQRRVSDDLLRLLSGLCAIAALAAGVGVLRHGPGFGPWALVFPAAGLVAFGVARALSKRKGPGDGA